LSVSFVTVDIFPFVVLSCFFWLSVSFVTVDIFPFVVLSCFFLVVC